MTEVQIDKGSKDRKLQVSEKTCSLDHVVSFIRRFVILSQIQVEAIALWVVHTYAFDSAETTPYLYIHSPEKRSGKTRLLEVLELLVDNPWFTGRVTPAVLTRKIDKECPTLLLDESDAAFASDKEYAQTLRAILNTGYRLGGKTSICVGQGEKMGYKNLSTFCPKAIAGIGHLPDTIADRSIPILLKRRAPSEYVEPFRRKKLQDETYILRKQISEWVENAPLDQEPDIPSELDDRSADCWEPLLAIADAAGGEWPQKARIAAVVLMTGREHEDDSLGVRLLSDIKSVFGDIDQIPSEQIIHPLIQLEESPWGDLNGRPLDARRLASILRSYDIRPQTIRIDEKTPKGYRRSDFIDSWSRYLPPSKSSATSATLASTHAQEPIRNIEPEPTSNVADNSQAQASFNVADVADKKPWKAEI